MLGTTAVRTRRAPALLYALVAALALAFASASLAAFFARTTPTYILGIEDRSLDPLLRDLHYPAVVYVAVSADKLSLLDSAKVLKSWRFGDLAVVKYIASSYDELVELHRRGIILSALAPRIVQFPEPVERVLDLLELEEIRQTLPIAAAYSGDAKRVFHHVTYRFTGRNVTICVVDSGVDYLHPDLRHAIWVMVSTLVVTKEGKPLVWIVGVNGSLEDAWKLDQYVYSKVYEYAFMDLNGHGSHVIGILVGSGKASGGKYKGFVPDAKIISIKAFTKYGVASLDSILTALKWIYDNAERFHIDLCSFSWGIPKTSDGSDPISMAVSKLIYDKGIIIVVAAGNSYFFPYTINIPAVCHGCIAVGAMNPYTYTIAPYSSAGPTPDGRIKPDFVGAGTLVVSTCPVTVESVYEKVLRQYHLDILMVSEYYCMMTGTSMATPAVAGIVAKVIQYLKETHQPVTLGRVLKILKSWTKPVNPITKDPLTGWGIPREP